MSDFLTETKVSDVCPSIPSESIVSCRPTDGILSVLRRLVSNNILSAPILGYSAGSNSNDHHHHQHHQHHQHHHQHHHHGHGDDGGNHAIGFVSMADLIALSVDWHDLDGLIRSLETAPPLTSNDGGGLGGKVMTVSDVMRKRPSNTEFHVVPDKASFIDALEIIARTGTHRIGVVPRNMYFAGKNVLCGVITQTAIVKFLEMNLGKVSDGIGQKKISASRFFRDVISIDEESPTWEAFNLMSTTKVSGVGITQSGTGKLVDQLSVKDLRLALNDKSSVKFEDFALPAAEFRSRYPSQHDLDDITTHPAATVSEVLAKLSKTHIHRVFVIDERGCPLGIVAERDIVQLIVKDHNDKQIKKNMSME